MKEIIVGLCTGRHDLPVAEYIFGNIADPSDVSGIQAQANAWVWEHCAPKAQYMAKPINWASGAWDEPQMWEGSVKLVIYVTGLTVALTAVVAACVRWGVSLELRHYDRNSGEYVPQPMW